MVASADVSLWQPIAVSLGAVCGALSRYYLTLIWTRSQGMAFPYGTLFVNVTGAFLIGFGTTWGDRLMIFSLFKPLSVIGFLGAYTTFSSYILEVVALLKSGRPGMAAGYGLGSPVLGMIFVYLGLALGQTLR